MNWLALLPESAGAGFASEASTEARAVSAFCKDGGQCLVAGTLVWMADGTTEPVERVRSGDWVLSRDPATGKVSASQVGACTERQAGSVVAVTLADAQTGQSQTVVASPEHPFFVSGKGFVAAASLGVGTQIVTRAGPCLTVTAVEERHDQKNGYAVYNFVVPGDHTYFVGSLQGGAWVHNPDVCLVPIGDGKYVKQLKLFPDQKYDRNLHYGDTPTDAQKASVPQGMEFDHDPPLVRHYYEGDGKGGLPGYNMTGAERKAFAKSLAHGKAATVYQQRFQGWKYSFYSSMMKKRWGLK